MAILMNTAIFLDQLQEGKRQSELLPLLENLEIQGVQVRGEFMPETTDAFEHEMTALVDECNAQHWELHYSVPKALFVDGAVNPKLAEYLKTAQQYELTSLKFSLGAASPEAIQVARDQIQSSSVTVTVENEGNDQGTEINLQEQLPVITKDGVIGFTFDAGNWYWVSKNYNVPAIFKKLKPYVTVLHLKNIDVKQLETTLLKDGDTDWQALVAQNDPSVPIFLEYAISTDEISSELKQVRAVLLGKE